MIAMWSPCDDNPSHPAKKILALASDSFSSAADQFDVS
jgi:hypothetical protein